MTTFYTLERNERNGRLLRETAKQCNMDLLLPIGDTFTVCVDCIMFSDGPETLNDAFVMSVVKVSEYGKCCICGEA